MINDINDFHRVFFIGVAGSGMSALAQYLSGTGKTVAGSDRYFENPASAKVRRQLEAEDISCYPFQFYHYSPPLHQILLQKWYLEHIFFEKIKLKYLYNPVLRAKKLFVFCLLNYN